MKGLATFLRMFVLSALTGLFAAAVASVYKLCAHHIIHFCESGYSFLRERPYLIHLALALLFLISHLLIKIYRRFETLKGGGIPNAVLASRGRRKLSPVLDSAGALGMSLLTFLLGVPLGNEGPCVQMGAALGQGAAAFAKGERENKYVVSAGACAGFAAATGAPLAGLAFCLDEIKRKPKLSMLICAAVSSIVCGAAVHTICPLIGIEASLLPELKLPEPSLKDIWIAALIGLAFGIFSVLLLKFYGLLRTFYNKTLGKVSLQYKIFAVLVLSLAAGLFSESFISTGHGLSVELLYVAKPLGFLVAALLVRTFLTLSANANGISGGTFVPLISIGITLSAILAVSIAAAGAEYYSLILMLGTTACIAGMMKMPLVSVLFAIETFACPQYILFIVVSAAISYALPEILKVKSISEAVLEEKE